MIPVSGRSECAFSRQSVWPAKLHFTKIRWRASRLGPTRRSFFRSLEYVILPACISYTFLYSAFFVFFRGPPCALLFFERLFDTDTHSTQRKKSLRVVHLAIVDSAVSASGTLHISLGGEHLCERRGRRGVFFMFLLRAVPFTCRRLLFSVCV